MEEKSLILYHGTDARFVRMSKEERMEYLDKCKKVIDYLWELFQPLWQKEVQQVTLPNGAKIFDSSSRKIEQLKSNFINAGEQELYSRLLSRLSMVDSWKGGSKWYQYDFLCVTGDKEKAERYAKRSFAGGEFGYIAYDLICGAEFLNLFTNEILEEISLYIEEIKIFSNSQEPIVITIDDLAPEFLYVETSDKPFSEIPSVLIKHLSFKYKNEYTLNLDNAYKLEI